MITNFKLSHAGAKLGDDAGFLVAGSPGELMLAIAGPVLPVGGADVAVLNLNQNFVGAGAGNVKFHNLHLMYAGHYCCFSLHFKNLLKCGVSTFFLFLGAY